ncbi:1-(5-phosphoribosyl)-5-[(5-phosphoribosylamino)methylideneamino]imidazole-4-carboxamide isomerase [Methylophilaceae bacterium]|nr:1-(5-phosphoribosyl)-5-[(5-phosphoribosylamino)methylideneamino]imidazole-4-carboxamide isomerase [Methylophilaceae bacterium]
MQVIPAIDLKEGKCVRLKQGLMDQATIFSEHPAEMATLWKSKGARRLHLVDLDGAFAGQQKNLSAIKEVIQEMGDIPIQLGGGIRNLDAVENLINIGIDSVIIGTAAITNPGFLHEACFAFPGQVIVGLDAKDGEVAINGWAKLTGHSVFEMAKKFEDYGVASIIYTDIGRDGMLQGINIDATVKLAENGNVPIIASGGLSDIKDIENLCAVANVGIKGVIAGRSIYEGTLDFEKANQLAETLTG